MGSRYSPEGHAPPAWEFTATGTRWRVYHSGGADEGVASEIAAAVSLDESRWSRFRPDSELSALNRDAGRWHAVSPETVELLEACEHWRGATGGVFQPLIAHVLQAWGYERSIAEGAPFTPATPTAQPATSSLELDGAQGRVRVPPGTAIDLGGIGKSWIAARAAALAKRICRDPALLIDAGGDLVSVTGDHLVAVEGGEPDDAAPQTWVRLGPGQAVATSGYGRRNWTNGDGRNAHHLIDPATGAPGPRVHATVLTNDAVTADVTAKVLALRPEQVRVTRCAALVTTPHQTLASSSWSEVVQVLPA